MIIYNQAPYCLQNAINELDLLEPGLTFMIVETTPNTDLYLCTSIEHPTYNAAGNIIFLRYMLADELL